MDDKGLIISLIQYRFVAVRAGQKVKTCGMSFSNVSFSTLGVMISLILTLVLQYIFSHINPCSSAVCVCALCP